MKSIITPYSKVFCFAFCTHLLVSLIWSLLYHFDLLKTSAYTTCVMISSVLIALASGIFLGLLIKKRAFVHAAAIAVVWILVSFAVHQTFSFALLARFAAKAAAFIAGTLCGRKFQSR